MVRHAAKTSICHGNPGLYQVLWLISSAEWLRTPPWGHLVEYVDRILPTLAAEVLSEPGKAVPLILTAFSEQLKLECNRERKPEHVLFEWLTRMLLMPPAPDDQVGRVLHTEIALIDINGYPGFEGKTDTGRQLLESLYKFCRSYDHWQFSRWIHELRASDFSEANI